MSTLYEMALAEVEKGNLKVSKQGNLELMCYTQDCFWGKDTWSPITTAHRGVLYYKGVAVNRPFTKIFNLDERPETALHVVLDRMKHEPYNIYDKANGHLFIVSAFVDDEGAQQIVMHTKGSLDAESDLLKNDIELFVHNHGAKLYKTLDVFPCITLMFEAIVEHDKHTLYDTQVEEYGSANAFVLLGVNAFNPEYAEWVEFEWNDLSNIAQFLEVPVVKMYDEVNGSPDQWLEHKGIEGYVIHFDNGDRVKIKTRDYWALRFQKDLHADKIIQMFRTAGHDRITNRLPEEVAEQIVAIINYEFQHWYNHIRVGVIPIEAWSKYTSVKPLTKQLQKELYADDTLTTEQKTYLSDYGNDKDRDYSRSKFMRDEFTKFYYLNEPLRQSLQSSLLKVVERLGQH